MEKQNQKSAFEEVAEESILLASRIPWWMSIAFGLFFFIILHQGSKPLWGSEPLVGQHFFFALMAFFIQLFLTFVFLFGAIISFIKQQRRESLMKEIAERPELSTLADMSWREFEVFVAEAFKLKGYAVSMTEDGADGGVDLFMKKDGERYIVQCKRWRAYKVGVDIVRELYGVMTARHAAGGFVVTSGHFTEAAINFAKGRNIELIDGSGLLVMMQAARDSLPEEKIASVMGASPPCPVCNRTMVRRTAKRGPNLGNDFWGCPAYPECTGIRQIDENMRIRRQER